jgi:DHA2 family multidrug resistance protein
MSEATANGWSPERSAAGGHNQYLIAFVVSIATFMEVLDTTIANVALRYIAGGLAVGLDESTYVITSYLVANAIVLSISGWLATVIGRKRFYMICVATFTLASLLCGFAWNLQSLVLFRIIQGLGGGGMATSEQAILADSFPPAKRGQAFAIYGVAVVVAPVVGPTLGGWITDTYSWHWVFLINVPMGLLSLFLVGSLVKEPSGAEEERERLLSRGLRFDYLGFTFIAVGLGCLEFVLDEGQRNDWFGSSMITGFALASAVSLLALIPWELTREDPIVDLRLFHGDARHRRRPDRDHADAAAIVADRAELYGDAGGPRAVAGRDHHHDHDAGRGPARQRGAAEISPGRRRRDHGGVDVAPDRADRRHHLWLRRLVAGHPRRRPAVPVPAGDHRLL